MQCIGTAGCYSTVCKLFANYYFIFIIRINIDKKTNFGFCSDRDIVYQI